MKYSGLGVVVCAAMIVGACSKSSDKVQASYISPLQYSNYDCEQLADESRRVSSRVAQVSGVQDEKATNDAVAMSVGLVLFWPALFFISGSDQEAELSRLKGEFDAVEQAAIGKKCAVADEIREAREAAERQKKLKEEEAKAASSDDISL